MDRYVNIGRAAEMLGVSRTTLRRWDASGRLRAERTPSGHRRYKTSEVASFNPLGIRPETGELPTIAYARVSSNDQREDLVRQAKVLEMFCAAHGWTYRVIRDLGSGMNYQKKGLNELLGLIADGRIGRLVITDKDRLLRFGAELVFSMCEMRNIEVVIINQGSEASFEEELASDVLEIITVFSARLYGKRSHKNKKLIADMREVMADVMQDRDTEEDAQGAPLPQ